MKTKAKPIQCEGWHRTGIFQMGGTGRWEQCRNKAVVLLTVKQNGKVSKQPACSGCHREARNRGIEIMAMTSIRIKR